MAAFDNKTANTKLRNRISGILIEKPEGSGGIGGADNLICALCAYFDCHMDRPEDDPLDDDSGWGEWVTEKADEAIDLIMDGVFQQVKEWEKEGGYR